MEKQIKIGPIRQSSRKKSNSVIREVTKQIGKMKLGEFFEVSGLDKTAVTNLRGAITYYSKKDRFKVVTKLAGETLTIERVRL
jgi:hypothetical protein